MDYNLDQLDEGMLPNVTIQEIAKEIGVENLLKVAQIVGGAEFYFPRKEKLLIQLRNQKIKEEFNGYNYSRLARKYELTEQRIRQICRIDKAEQISLFVSN